MKGSGGVNTGISTMDVGGNFSFTAGAISENSTSNTGKGLIVFNGTGVQTYTSGGTRTATDSIGWTVNSGATLYMGGTQSAAAELLRSPAAERSASVRRAVSQPAVRLEIFKPQAGHTTPGTLRLTVRSRASNNGNGLPSIVNQLTINNSAGATLTNSFRQIRSIFTAGAFTVNAATTLTINNLVTVVAGSLTSATTGTVNYSHAANGQTVLPASYGNLHLAILMGMPS